MRFVLLLLFLLPQTLHAQKLNIDSAIALIAAEKNEEKKVDHISRLYNSDVNNNPEYVTEAGIKLLRQAQKDHDRIAEASAFTLLGQGYRLGGNLVRGLAYHQKAIVLAEKTGNMSILSMAENQAGNIYKDREEYERAIEFYNLSTLHSLKGTNKFVKTWGPMNLGYVYNSINQLDSALKYAQMSYQSELQIEGLPERGLTYLSLAGIYSKMNQPTLALSYYGLESNVASHSTSPRYQCLLNTGLAEHYARNNQPDSVQFYARLAIQSVVGTPLFLYGIRPAKMLADFFENSNCDSSLKYARLYRAANDSLFSKKASQQIQMMTLDEDLRKQELAAAKIAENEERKQTIQYALIAIGIVTLVMIFLLLSRSMIISAKMITFLSVLALLMVFEFINLLIHPFLERVTHHSPILMLLALVTLAAILVPLHHKIEHWATKKLLAKNKAVRIAAAKKILEEFETSNQNPGN